MKRYRVAFSYASENRSLVGRAAILIAEVFGENAVLYDKFHEGEFARDDLARDLPRRYEEESDLIVVVISPDYLEKEWPGLEWDTIREVIRRRLEHEANAVMLCRLNKVTPEGLDADVGPGFVELDEKSAGQFAKLVLQRLAANNDKERDHYLHQLHRRYLRRSTWWFLFGVLAPLPVLGLYPAPMRAMTILLSALLMGVTAVAVNFMKVRFRYAAIAFAATCVTLFFTYRSTVVLDEVTLEHGWLTRSAYVTGTTTVPSNKSPSCDCIPGTSALPCAQGAPSSDEMNACFGANRILFAEALLVLLYFAAASSFTAAVRLIVIERRTQ